LQGDVDDQEQGAHWEPPVCVANVYLQWPPLTRRQAIALTPRDPPP